MMIPCENCGKELSHTYIHFEEESIHIFCDQTCCEEWLEDGEEDV